MMSSNAMEFDDEQRGELEVLQSIYPNEFVDINLKEPPYTFSVYVQIDLPTRHGFAFEVKRSSSSSSKSTTGARFVLSFLPPIQINISFPSSYPGHSPPRFTLSCAWLDGKQLSRLCRRLDEIWSEQEGIPVVFAWLDWLKNSTLEYLDIENGNTISEANNNNNINISDNNNELVLSDPSLKDARAIPALRDFERDLFPVLEYNYQKETEEFYNTPHLCDICFSDKPGKEFLRLPCGHFFCIDCFKEYCEMHINEGSVMDLNCMHSGCKEQLPQSHIQQLVTPQMYDRYERLLLAKTLDSMSDITYCPRCDNVVVEDTQNLGRCLKCDFAFCTLCRDCWHQGECISVEDKIKLLELKRDNKHASFQDKRDRERRLADELKNEAYIKKSARLCPNCKMAIQKTEGCNKVKCSNCHVYLCYICGEQISGYEHFSNYESGGCGLWVDKVPSIAPPLQQDGFFVAQARRTLNPNYAIEAKKCPICRQENIKDGGNNHILCWACGCHWCWMCRQKVEKTSQHFGPQYPCKQHS